MPEFSTFLMQQGIPQEFLSWLLVLPVAISAIVLARQIVGVRGSSIATPLFLGSVFSIIGVQTGLLTYAAMLCAGLIARFILQRIRLLYLPKIAVLLITAIAALIAVVPFIPSRELFRSSHTALAFVVLVLSVEPFLTMLLERGPKKLIAPIGEAFLLSIIAFLLITWGHLRELAVSYPLFMLLGTLTINILVGKWTGLRILEYVRFGNIIFKKK